MHHVTLNRAGPNDGDFNDDIIKTFRLHARQRGHLRAALDLENADGIGVTHHVERLGVIFGDMCEIECATTLPAELEGILHDRHHAQTKKVDFDDAKIFTIVLIPLRHDSSGHGRIL